MVVLARHLVRLRLRSDLVLILKVGRERLTALSPRLYSETALWFWKSDTVLRWGDVTAPESNSAVLPQNCKRALEFSWKRSDRLDPLLGFRVLKA